MPRDSQETDPELQLARFRGRRDLSTLNIELGIIGINKTIASNERNEGATPGNSTLVTNIVTGTIGGGVIGCFIADTQIDVFTKGTKNIKDILVGIDKVRCFDPYTKDILVRDVIGKWEHVVDEILMLDFEDGTTGTTKNHGYFTENGIYRPVWELDSVWHWDKRWTRRKIKEKRVIEGKAYVYNITVAEVHNYFANKDAVSNAKVPFDPNP